MNKKESNEQRLAELRQALKQAEMDGNADDVILYSGQIAAIDRMQTAQISKAKAAQALEAEKHRQEVALHLAAFHTKAESAWIDAIKAAVKLADVDALSREYKAIAREARECGLDPRPGYVSKLEGLSAAIRQYLYVQWGIASTRKNDETFKRAGITDDSFLRGQIPNIPASVNTQVNERVSKSTIDKIYRNDV